MTRAAPSNREQLRSLWVLIATSFVDMVGFSLVLPLLPFYAQELQASPRMIGWIIASYSIAQLVAAPLWGRVSDRYGRRPALLIGLTASAVAYVVFGLAGSVWLLVLSRVVQGAGGGTTGVAQAYVTDTVEPARRAQALGWLSSATAAAFSVGPVLGSLASHLGQAAPGFLAAALCLINVFFAWRWLPESRVHHESGPRPPVWHAAWTVLQHPRRQLSRLIWIYGVGMLAFTCLTSVLALYLGAEFAVTKETIGYFFAYVSVISIVMRAVLLGPIVRRIGETGAMRIGTLTLAVGLGLFPLVNSIGLMALIIPLVPIGTALLFPATTSLMSASSTRSEMGTTLGVAQSFAGVARVVAPVAATWAFQDLGHGMPFLLAAAIVALVGLLTLRIDAPRHPGEPAAAAVAG